MKESMNILRSIISFVAVFALVSCGKSPEQEKEVLAKLAQIDAAKEQWALESKKKDGDEAPQKDIEIYIKGGFPKHPWGGHYIINPVGKAPESTTYGPLPSRQ